MKSRETFTSIPYESRNLGVEAFSLSAMYATPNTIECLSSAVCELEGKYGKVFIQARIPKNEIKTSILLQRSGFYVVEMTISPYSKLLKNTVLKSFIEAPFEYLPSKYQSNPPTVKVIDKKVAEIQSTVEAIAQESFIDDRFHIDPNCPDVTANFRFVQWVKDLYSNPKTTFHLLSYNNTAAGFLCRQDEKLILAGFSKAYRNSGLGAFLWLSVMQEMLSQGFKRTYTLISVNNVSVLNLYARLGYQFRDPEITLHYWSV